MALAVLANTRQTYFTWLSLMTVFGTSVVQIIVSNKLNSFSVLLSVMLSAADRSTILSDAVAYASANLLTQENSSICEPKQSMLVDEVTSAWSARVAQKE